MREEHERMIVELDLDRAAHEFQQAITHHEQQLMVLRAQLDLIASLRSLAEAQARETLPPLPGTPGAPGGPAAPDAPPSE
jgi:hypothetical protein